MASYRISLGCAHDQIRLRLSQLVDLPPITDWIDREQFTPRYNIGPRGDAVVILFTAGADEGSLNGVATSRLVLRTMPWGVVSQEEKDGKVKDVSTFLIGADVLRKRENRWRTVRDTKRCVVVCEGYHLWHHTEPPGSSKVSYFVLFEDNRVMFLAGLYDECSTSADPSDITLRFALMTTAANSEMKWLKDRQPVILSTESDMMAWLDVSSGTWLPQLFELFRAHDENDTTKKLTWYQVPKEVGNARKSSRKLVTPVHRRPDGTEIAVSRIVPDIEEVQPPQAGGSTLAGSSSQSVTATQTASSSTQATSSQPAAPISASQGIRPTRARARAKTSGGVQNRRTTKAKKGKSKDDDVPPEGRLTHYFTS